MTLTINHSALLHSKALVNDLIGWNTCSQVTQAVGNPVRVFHRQERWNFPVNSKSISMTASVLGNKNMLLHLREGNSSKVFKRLVRQTEIRSPFKVGSVLHSVGISDLQNKPQQTKPLQFSYISEPSVASRSVQFKETHLIILQIRSV